MDDLRVAIRSLLSTPGPTLVIVGTLALAIAANTAVFSLVSGVLLRPLGYGDDSRLVVPWATHGADRDGSFRLSPADYRDLRDEADAFDGQVGLYRFIGSTLTGLDEPARVGSLTMTPRMLEVLEAAPALGRLFNDDDERPGGTDQAMLTYASWRIRFGADPDIVGSTVEIDGAPRLIVGVTEEGFHFPPDNPEVEIYFPMRLSDAVLLDRNHRMFDGLARLADGVSLGSARAELDAIAARLAEEFPDTNEGWGLTVRPLRNELVGDLGTTLWVLSGAVFLVLAIGCANVANLLVARSSATAREFAVRAALGARGRHLVRRSLVESLVLGGIGGLTGVLLAYWSTALLRTLVPADIPRGQDISIDIRVLAFAALLSLGATALFGSLSAIRATSPDLLDLLKPSSSGGKAGGGRRLREAMVVIEVALAIVLLVGAGLLVRSFTKLSAVDPGFRRDGVVSVAVQLPGARYPRERRRPALDDLVERARGLPGVRSAGAVSDLPMSSVGLDMEMEFEVPGLDAISPGVRPNADFRLALPGYFEAMGMEIVAGRDLDPLDTSGGRNVAVVNETLVERYFPEVDPIGRAVTVPMMGDVTVVGVVSNIRHGGLQSKHEAEAYLAFGQLTTAEMHLVVHSDRDAADVGRAIAGVLHDMDPQLVPSQIVSVAELLRESVARPRFNTALLVALALCAAALAVVGTYGIVAYSVARRSGEIGIRMALGADGAATQRLVMRQALSLVLIGAGLGAVGAFGASRFLRQLLFEVEPTDPLTFAAVLTAALTVGALAAWSPARKATRIDPVVALRDE